MDKEDLGLQSEIPSTCLGKTPRCICFFFGAAFLCVISVPSAGAGIFLWLTEPYEATRLCWNCCTWQRSRPIGWEAFLAAAECQGCSVSHVCFLSWHCHPSEASQQSPHNRTMPFVLCGPVQSSTFPLESSVAVGDDVLAAPRSRSPGVVQVVFSTLIGLARWAAPGCCQPDVTDSWALSWRGRL